jgi:hypothetical protein
MAIFSANNLHGNKINEKFFALNNCLLHICAFIGCCHAIWSMRRLHFIDNMHQSNTEVSKDNIVSINNCLQQLLDKLLLTIGLIGELVYSIASIVALVYSKKLQWNGLNTIIIAVHVSRLLQV